MSFLDIIKDWPTGNYYDYTMENDIYNQLLDLIDQLEEKLEIVALKGTLSDAWATFGYSDTICTLLLLKNLIELRIKQNLENLNKSTLIELEHLQRFYKKMEKIVKNNIIKVCSYSEGMEEVYWNLVEIKKILLNSANLKAIKSQNFDYQNLDLTYNQIHKLKQNIAIRKCEIVPYIEDMDYQKKR